MQIGAAQMIAVRRTHEDGGIKEGDHADRGSSDDSSKEDP